MSPAERAALAEAVDAQRKRLFTAGSILALLREALDDQYAGGRTDAPDLSYAVGAVMCIVDRVAGSLEELHRAEGAPTTQGGVQ